MSVGVDVSQGERRWWVLLCAPVTVVMVVVRVAICAPFGGTVPHSDILYLTKICTYRVRILVPHYNIFHFKKFSQNPNEASLCFLATTALQDKEPIRSL